MTVLTPGVAFLGRGFACFSMYLSTAYYGTVKIAESQDVSLPTWTVIAGAVVAAPVLGRLYVVYRNYSRRRRAAQLGARLVPKCQGKVPGNLDIMKISLDSIAFGYPGEFRRILFPLPLLIGPSSLNRRRTQPVRGRIWALLRPVSNAY
jgi:hypothetical protein